MMRLAVHAALTACFLLAGAAAGDPFEHPEYATSWVEWEDMLERARAVTDALAKRVAKLQELNLDHQRACARNSAAAERAGKASGLARDLSGIAVDKAEALPTADLAAMTAAEAAKSVGCGSPMIDAALREAQRLRAANAKALKGAPPTRAKAPEEKTPPFITREPVARSEGHPRVIRDGVERALKPFELWRPTDKFIVGPKDRVTLFFKGGGAVWLTPGEYTLGEEKGGLLIEVKQGAVHYYHRLLRMIAADHVVPAPPPNPIIRHANVSVATKGTEFDFGADAEGAFVRPFDGLMILAAPDASSSTAAAMPPAGSLARVLDADGSVEGAQAGADLAAGASVSVGPGGRAELSVRGGYVVALSSGARLALRASGAQNRPVFALLSGTAEARCAGCVAAEPVLFMTPNAALTAKGASWRMRVAPSGLSEIRLRSGALEVAATVKRLDLAGIEPSWLSVDQN